MSNTIVRQGYTDVYIPESDVIDTAYYDSETQRLFIALHNGTRVGYKGFTEFSWLTFKNFGSAGKFWNRYIKGCYDGLNGDVELYDRAIEREPLPQSPSVDSEGAVVTTVSAVAPFGSKQGFGTSVINKNYHVLVKVSAGSLTEAAQRAESLGTVVSVTAL